MSNLWLFFFFFFEVTSLKYNRNSYFVSFYFISQAVQKGTVDHRTNAVFYNRDYREGISAL